LLDFLALLTAFAGQEDACRIDAEAIEGFGRIMLRSVMTGPIPFRKALHYRDADNPGAKVIVGGSNAGADVCSFLLQRFLQQMARHSE